MKFFKKRKQFKKKPNEINILSPLSPHWEMSYSGLVFDEHLLRAASPSSQGWPCSTRTRGWWVFTALQLFGLKTWFYLFVCLSDLGFRWDDSLPPFFGVAITVVVHGIQLLSCSYIWQTLGSDSLPHPGQPGITKILLVHRIQTPWERAGFEALF